jgi:methionine-rich copper-binding protein CopC
MRLGAPGLGRPRRAAAAAALWTLGLVVGGVASASAHALLMDSAPKPGQALTSPPRLVLQFNGRIEKQLSTVRLVGGPRSTKMLLVTSDPAAGPEVLAFTLPGLEPGPYRVEWKVLSTDGHLTEGAVPFTVVAPAATR